MAETKLEKAFAEMRRRGIVARHNFMDCSTCGEKYPR